MIISRRRNIYTICFIAVIFTCAASYRLPGMAAMAASDTSKLTGQSQAGDDDVFFETLFKQYPGVFDSVLAHRRDWNVQIIYTEVNRNNNNIPTTKSYYFNRAGARYFYPASSIKLPVALLALQRLQELKASGIEKFSTMITEPVGPGLSGVYNEPNSTDGIPNIASYIKKILLVSDNDAYNRLYEFLGQEYINRQLKAKQYESGLVMHRLEISLTDSQNRVTNPIDFYRNGRLMLHQPTQLNKVNYPQRSDSMGKGYYANGKLVNKAMDFSTKNRLSLHDLHSMLMGLILPGQLPASKQFSISEEDRAFVLKYMSAFPRESMYPSYDTANYPDASSKFILYGGEKGTKPANLRIFSKSGQAYGQLVDAAYVVDLDKNIEFMVSAAIYCNADGILNDDVYEYESIGLPFMKNLGKALYDRELKRKRNQVPDLSGFRFSYDK